MAWDCERGCLTLAEGIIYLYVTCYNDIQWAVLPNDPHSPEQRQTPKTLRIARKTTTIARIS